MLLFYRGHLLISSLHRLHQIAILLEILFLFFCTAACPSGWCSCCCGCCTLHLENGLVANGNDDGVGVPVGAVELYSAGQLFPILTLAGLMSLPDVGACLGFAIKVVVNVCKFRLHFLHSCSCFLLSGFHHVGWLDVWPRRCGACFALPSCSIFHSLVMEGLHTSFIDFMYFLFT